MAVFWRETDLSPSEMELLGLCLDAHAKSAFRQNISMVMVAQTAVGSGDYTKALIAALCNLGGLHAPLVDTWKVLADAEIKLGDWIAQGLKIPGWGNSFEKGHADPIWNDVQGCLEKHFPAVAQRIADITALLHASGRNVFPNPSCYTAATGLALGLPPQVLPWILIQGRLTSWTAVFCRQLNLAVVQSKTEGS